MWVRVRFCGSREFPVTRRERIINALVFIACIAVLIAISVTLLVVSGCAWTPQKPTVVVHKYDYQTRPPALSYGTPPLPPWMPPAVDYQTIYESSWDDPTLVIFKNGSYFNVRIEVDEKKPMTLVAYGATANLHLGVGEHKVRQTTKKPTQAHGTLEVIKFFTIYIRPEGRSQIIHVYE